MKLFVLSCLLALAVAAPEATPEADPYYGYASAYGGYPQVAYPTTYARYGSYGAVPSTYGSFPTAAVSYAHPTSYASNVYANNVYGRHIFKREAEAEPEAEADPALVYAGNQYQHGVYGYAQPAFARQYSSPFALGSQVRTVQHPYSGVAQQFSTYAHVAQPFSAYNTYPVAAYAGLRYKREADSEAEPQFYQQQAYSPFASALGYTQHQPAVYANMMPKTYAQAVPHQVYAQAVPQQVYSGVYSQAVPQHAYSAGVYAAPHHTYAAVPHVYAGVPVHTKRTYVATSAGGVQHKVESY